MPALYFHIRKAGPFRFINPCEYRKLRSDPRAATQPREPPKYSSNPETDTECRFRQEYRQLLDTNRPETGDGPAFAKLIGHDQLLIANCQPRLSRRTYLGHTSGMSRGSKNWCSRVNRSVEVWTPNSARQRGCGLGFPHPSRSYEFSIVASSISMMGISSFTE